MAKRTFDWLTERNEIENKVNEIQDICLIREMKLKEVKQEVLQLTDSILYRLDNIDYAIDDIESEYEDKIDELNERIQELEFEINELKGGKNGNQI